MQNDFMQLPEALELCDFASLGDELGSNDSGDDDGHLEKKARVAAAGVVGEESLSAAEKAERRCACARASRRAVSPSRARRTP